MKKIHDRILDKRKESLTKAYRELYPDLYAIARQILRNHQDLADDAVANVFVRVLGKIDTPEWKRRMVKFPYLSKAARNEAIEYLRKEQKKKAHDPMEMDEALDGASFSNSVDEAYLRGEILALALSVVAMFSSEDQQIFRKIYIEHKKLREVADELGLPLQTVESRKKKMIKHLRQKFAALGLRRWTFILTFL